MHGAPGENRRFRTQHSYSLTHGGTAVAAAVRQEVELAEEPRKKKVFVEMSPVPPNSRPCGRGSPSNLTTGQRSYGFRPAAGQERKAEREHVFLTLFPAFCFLLLPERSYRALIVAELHRQRRGYHGMSEP